VTNDFGSLQIFPMISTSIKKAMNSGSGDSKTHICPGCEFPIAIYGRLHPCTHAYCLRCSSRLTKCAMYASVIIHSQLIMQFSVSSRYTYHNFLACSCQQGVASVERLDRGNGIFISPVTLQSFTSESIRWSTTSAQTTSLLAQTPVLHCCPVLSHGDALTFPDHLAHY